MVSTLERISRREEFDLFIAWIAISFAFAIIILRNTGRVDPVLALLFIGISLITVGIGFILHEMAHKFTAIRYGYWAEFRKDNIMLLVAVALAALVGVVFAAPGATVIYSNTDEGMSRKQNGKISVAGPLVNLLLCIPFFLMVILGWGWNGSGWGNLVSMVGMIGLQVNAMIAAFNMIPVSILDGRKVLAWNKAVFAVTIVAAFAVLIISYSPELLLGLIR